MLCLPVTIFSRVQFLIHRLVLKVRYMTQEVGRETLTSIAIGEAKRLPTKRQDAKDYVLELYESKKNKHSKFDFQSLLDKEMEKLNE